MAVMEREWDKSRKKRNREKKRKQTDRMTEKNRDRTSTLVLELKNSMN